MKGCGLTINELLEQWQGNYKILDVDKTYMSYFFPTFKDKYGAKDI